jgi:hypothetical protein
LVLKVSVPAGSLLVTMREAAAVPLGATSPNARVPAGLVLKYRKSGAQPGVADPVGLGVKVGVWVGVDVAVAVAVTIAVEVAVAVGMLVEVAVAVGVGVAVFVAVAVVVAVDVAVGVAVAVGGFGCASGPNVIVKFTF